jgi:hypothetical protein
MGRDPAKRTSPDLLPTATASAASLALMPTTENTPQRYILPKNLSDAVKYLNDGELPLMHAATVEELKRRGRTPKSAEADLPTRPDLTRIQPTKNPKLNEVEFSLTRGQVNAVRSSFKAGITPARIAREFGIYLSDVRRALARDETKR